MKNAVTVCVALAGALACYAWAQTAPTSARPVWEYKVLDVYQLARIESVTELLQQHSESASSSSADATEQPGLFAGLERIGRSVNADVTQRIEAGLNALGKDGWELAAEGDKTFILKRLRQ